MDKNLTCNHKNIYENVGLTINFKIKKVNYKSESKKSAYLMIESIIYICLSILVLSSILLLLTSTMKLEKRQADLFDLNEIALKTEDIVRYELENSTGIILDPNKKYTGDYVVSKYIKYLSYEDLSNKRKHSYKYFKHASNKLYISIPDGGKYQISNNLKVMSLKPVFDEEDQILSLSIKLVFEKTKQNSNKYLDKNKVSVTREFTVYF